MHLWIHSSTEGFPHQKSGRCRQKASPNPRWKFTFTRTSCGGRACAGRATLTSHRQSSDGTGQASAAGSGRRTWSLGGKIRIREWSADWSTWAVLTIDLPTAINTNTEHQRPTTFPKHPWLEMVITKPSCLQIQLVLTERNAFLVPKGIGKTIIWHKVNTDLDKSKYLIIPSLSGVITVVSPVSPALTDMATKTTSKFQRYIHITFYLLWHKCVFITERLNYKGAQPTGYSQWEMRPTNCHLHLTDCQLGPCFVWVCTQSSSELHRSPCYDAQKQSRDWTFKVVSFSSFKGFSSSSDSSSTEASVATATETEEACSSRGKNANHLPPDVVLVKMGSFFATSMRICFCTSGLSSLSYRSLSE